MAMRVEPFEVAMLFHQNYESTAIVLTSVFPQRGISLLSEVPDSRTCADAGIAPHWCGCLSWKNVKVGDSHVRRAASALVATINNLTKTERGQCEQFTLGDVTLAVRYRPLYTDLIRPCPQRVTCWISLRHFPRSWTSFSIPFALASLLMASIHLSGSLPIGLSHCTVMLSTCCMGSCSPLLLKCPCHCSLLLVRYIAIV